MNYRICALCCALIAWTLVAPAQAQDAGRKVIIDDEGFELMHLTLLESSKIDVIGITSVSGNTWANRATAMALRGLEISGHEAVPVAEGATYPLLNSEALTDRWEALYGKLTWKGAWMKEWVEPTVQSTPDYFGPDDPVNLPQGNPTLQPTGEIAANFMIRLVRAHPGEITIVACGPLTNLALAQRLDPGFASLVGELIYMGGSLNPQQVLDNVSAEQFAREFENSPRREFNVRFDPEAASIVSRSPWPKLTVVPIDPSTGTQRTPELLQRMSKAAKPGVAEFIAQLEPGFPLWDEIVAGYLLDPGIATETEDLYVDYNTQFGPGYGDMLSWHEHYQPGLGERKAHVVRTVDAKRLEALMVEAMREGAR
ncbi:nucleoside hydrolase [Parahaliea maris]|uniref:Nucleoside hydrolase n=1 Tax=Parahaliea maris TaxID=2716870 RepID=A0A5C9A3I6_9GAMM|nr:nucleoside hydrolase [Parahaliea maris]TXS95276.1 nucleoside hydrolase [Parahaliea maris]